MQLPTEHNEPADPIVSGDPARPGRDTPGLPPPPSTAALDGMLAGVRAELRAEERRRLLFELHDGLGPTLAALALGLRAAHNAVDRSPAVAVRLLAELEHEAQRGILELRRLTGDRTPAELDGLGLLTALRRRVAALSGGITVELDLPESLPPLPDAVTTAVHRIAGEALTNMAKHAGARSCLLRLWCDHELHLEIVDDGIGLTTGKSKGIGLRSMRERARELHGECRVETVPGGRGTRVTVRLPLHRRSE